MAKVMRSALITAEEARNLFAYDPVTGSLTRRVTVSNNARAGQIITCRNSAGYRVVRAFGRLYRTSRIIWLMQTGAWPPHEVDHRDRDKANEAWENLRSATRPQNQANTEPSAANTSGYKGVYFSRPRGCWLAQIRVLGVWHGLGAFDSAEDAHAAYAAKARELYGEFAAA